MKELSTRLQNLIKLGKHYIDTSTENDLSYKPNPEKWSKKEILGHLIDSGINNLQRFTEIQFKGKPYKTRMYNQDELVKANDYQNSDINEIVSFWVSINQRIINIINRQTEETLDFEIELYNGDMSDLRFLMNDYVDHLSHHLNQITGQ